MENQGNDVGFKIDDDYVREVSNYYWVEEWEYKLGIHPTQVLERIKKWLKDHNYGDSDIVRLDWDEYPRPKVKVTFGGCNCFSDPKYVKDNFAVFDYYNNDFVDIV